MTNKKVFYSKKSIALGFIIWGSLLSVLFVLTRNQHWIALLIMLPIVIFCANILFGTKYTVIGDQELKIQCGLIHVVTLDISKINVIEKSWSLISAPANSIDRIKITYNNHHSVLISPPDKKAFANMLLEINPKIKILF